MEHIPSQRVMELYSSDRGVKELMVVAKALGSETRLEILRFLGTHTCSLLEIASALELPQSTATLHINILEQAGLIKTDLQNAKRGVQKVCARIYDRVIIQLPAALDQKEVVVQYAMPIGAYVDAEITPTCGLLSNSGIIGHLDDPASFFEPLRIKAQLIWFQRGFVEYRFPIRHPLNSRMEALELTFEVCSEAPLHHDNWPSDITVWINNREISTWTSPADFGGERGRLTPAWWDTNNTQFGLLKNWKVTQQGNYIDGINVSKVNLEDLHILDGELLSIRIGVKSDAQHIGGINLFGSQFGNYPQDIILRQIYHPNSEEDYRF
ncbi:MAG: helix-turn-helix domain-containing protein [Anaerolineaceae bacterium]|nr:helix-turn-helix domain-containing protein [Anaerolineaceae bacterium]